MIIHKRRSAVEKFTLSKRQITFPFDSIFWICFFVIGISDDILLNTKFWQATKILSFPLFNFIISIYIGICSLSFLVCKIPNLCSTVVLPHYFFPIIKILLVFSIKSFKGTEASLFFSFSLILNVRTRIFQKLSALQKNLLFYQVNSYQFFLT